MGAGPFSSDSKSKVTTTTQNAGFSEIEGAATSLNITGGGKKSNQNITVNSLDGGAIAVGRDVAIESLRSSADAQRNVFEFGDRVAGYALDSITDSGSRLLSGLKEALGFASDTQSDTLRFADKNFNEALNFGNYAASREHATLSDALDFGRDTVSDQNDFARDLFGQSLTAVTGVLKEGQAQLGNTVSNLNTIARQQSTSSDERIQQIAATALKAVGVIAGLFVLGFILQRYVK